MITFISNPLPSALAHYQSELSETLTRTGVQHKSANARPVEDLPGKWGNVRKLSNAVTNSRFPEQSSSKSIQCWPSLGLLEPLLWRKKGVKNFIVYHDPVPIRKQIGFDSISRALAQRQRSPYSPVIMTHSDDAASQARRLFPYLQVIKVLHPVMSEIRGNQPIGESVIVAGQYKPERNLKLLAELGPKLRARNLRPKILGRGWPQDIPGWEIDSRFLPEEELDQAIDESAVVLIPYRNYFQSGIAIRALERGRLSITPENSFARDLLGHSSPSIYAPDAAPFDVLGRILTTIESTVTPESVFDDYRKRVDESWAAFSARQVFE